MKKREIIKLTSFVLIFVLLSGISPVFSEGFERYGLIIDDISLDKEITASTLEGITYVPLSKIGDTLEIKVAEEEGTMIISRQNRKLVLKIQQDKAFPEKNGTLGNSYAYIKDKTVYIPIIFLVDYLDFDVEVLYDVKCIRIKTKPNVLLAGQIYNSSLTPTAEIKQPTAANIEKSHKIAYLTFDDGLDSKVTPEILDILKQYGAKATFFIIGNTVNKNKGILKRIVNEGHKVGNHTYTHNRDIIYTDVDNFSKELAKTSKAIYDVVGITPNLFRPPYGAPYIRGEEYKTALSQYKTVLWNVDSMDSRVKGINSGEIAVAVKRQVKGKRNAIILFHSTSAREETAKALPEIIQYLIDEGYTIASME
jgi:peptidoglycan/xylan/chitin deacetylase (PgdA/CDA1 family)